MCRSRSRRLQAYGVLRHRVAEYDGRGSATERADAVANVAVGSAAPSKYFNAMTLAACPAQCAQLSGKPDL